MVLMLKRRSMYFVAAGVTLALLAILGAIVLLRGPSLCSQIENGQVRLLYVRRTPDSGIEGFWCSSKEDALAIYSAINRAARRPWGEESLTAASGAVFFIDGEGTVRRKCLILGYLFLRCDGRRYDGMEVYLMLTKMVANGRFRPVEPAELARLPYLEQVRP